MAALQNANPKIYNVVDDDLAEEEELTDADDSSRDAFTAQEVFDMIRHLNDPGSLCTIDI